MQGLKRKRRCQNQCFEHLFSLKNLKNNPKYDIKLTFCPKFQRQPLPPEHTFAQFNDDGHFYTSAFVLGVDKKGVAKNLQKQMLEHQKLIKENCQKYNQVVFPRPNSKHTTCSVCKQTYKNYYQHIFSDEHTDKIQSSSYNVCIQELCQLFKEYWDGCAQKADQAAQRQRDGNNYDAQIDDSEQLNPDDILQQEQIEQYPSEHEKYIEEESKSKQVVIRKPVRSYESINPIQPVKVYEDRESRKKNINFAAYFQQYPKKKIVNQNRQPVTVSSKKLQKIPSKTDPKAIEIPTCNKSIKLEQNDPFIIEYNARAKRKQKKSYYYIKKKQRQERELRERQLLLEEKRDLNQNQTPNKKPESDEQLSDYDENQNQEKISSQEEYQQYLEDFHQNQNRREITTNTIKKTASHDLTLFEVVQKKPYLPSIFQTIPNPDYDRKIHNSTSKFINPINSSLQNLAIKQLTESTLNSTSKPTNFEAPYKQKQQFSSHNNKIHYSSQNQLPLYHKLKNPLQKQNHKENQTKLQKDSQKVFNEYEQKFKEYQQEKDNKTKANERTSQKSIQKSNQRIFVFAESNKRGSYHDNDESTVKNDRNYAGKLFQETYRYAADKTIYDTNNPTLSQVKSEAYKSNNYSETYYKNQSKQKQIANTVNPLNAPGFPHPHQFYPAYGYPIPSYGYPMSQSLKGDRPPAKYGQPRQTQVYERGYYYGGWPPSYYMQPPPGALVSTPNPVELQAGHKIFPNPSYNGPKAQNKQMVYPSYPGYPPGYGTTAGYPGYYPTPGTHYPPTQRPEYQVPSNPNMRTAQPNTSININFPMYMGPPYHGNYPYQSNAPRYVPSQPNSTPLSGQYLAPTQNPAKTPPSQFGGYGSTSASSSLPPYAQYQQYKKRQNERRR